MTEETKLRIPPHWIKTRNDVMIGVIPAPPPPRDVEQRGLVDATKPNREREAGR
jgi:hypothetical protein